MYTYVQNVLVSWRQNDFTFQRLRLVGGVPGFLNSAHVLNFSAAAAVAMGG